MTTNAIIDSNIDNFLNQIKSLGDIGQHHNFDRKSGGFPLFVEGRTTYYEQNYYEERIENAIWKYLINGVLKEMFSDDYCQKRGISVSWSWMHPQLVFSYVEEIENRFPIEFIIVNNGKRTAYRYTNWYCMGEKREQFFQAKEIDEMVIIDFSSDDLSSMLHPALVSEKVSTITAKEFFESYFSKDFFDEYLLRTRAAVTEAYKYLGFQTITNLSSQNLPAFISEMLKEFEHTDFTVQQYQVLGQLKGWKKRKYDDPGHIISRNDYESINRRFFDCHRFYSMCGAADYAHSLITSEYLYKTMKDNNQFDFTAIVCGYLKSIEQLLYKMVLYTLDHHTGELWIKAKGYDKKNPQNFKYIDGRTARHVKFEKGLERYFDTTFASLVNLLDDNIRGWGISQGAKDAITVRLGIYCDECRNEHFHKDNISTIDEVDVIRQNTFLLFYYVLGGYLLADDIGKDKGALQIVDRSYETLYERIMQFGGGHYYLLGFTDNEEILVAMPMSQENPVYDSNGSLTNAVIRFVKIQRTIEEDWHKDNWGEIEHGTDISNMIFVTPENLPSKITYIDILTNRRTPII